RRRGRSPALPAPARTGVRLHPSDRSQHPRGGSPVRRSIAVPAAAAALLSLAVSACGTGSSTSTSSDSSGKTAKVQGGPGVDLASKTISIGDITALTGPAAALGNAVAAGHRAYFDGLNARGGIDGGKGKGSV